jgi:UPF0176 protein
MIGVLFHDAFYRFHEVTDPDVLAARLEAVCRDAGVLGSILVAGEGINGMLCGSAEALQIVRDALEGDSRFTGLMYKRTACETQVFKRLKIRLKPEIVPLGIPGVDASQHHRRDRSPLEWRELLRRDDVIVIDNRNAFEFELGHFRGAINPGVEHFREFAAYMDAHLPAWEAEGKSVAMYCTGGIRCEKTTAWLAMRGHTVLQLEGGILNYFQQLEDADADFEGSCFVFDAREALDTRLQAVKLEDAAQVVSDPARLFSSSR